MEPDNQEEKTNHKSEEKTENSGLEKEFEECQNQRDEYLAGWQRARADFINYKREEGERIGNFLRQERKDLILAILPVLDSFARAESEVTAEIAENQIIKGFLQIRSQMQDILKSLEVEELNILGEKFNPEKAEAMEEVEVENLAPGTITEILQKGYKMEDKIIRAAKVKVAK